jgi:hypothetical protein
MPTHEFVTFCDAEMVIEETVTGNTQVVGEIIDTADYDIGVAFGMAVMLDDGVNTKFALVFEHGDESDLSDAVALEKENLVFGRKTGVLPWQLGNNTPGFPRAKLTDEGVWGTKRYVRATLNVTDWDGTGGTKVGVFAVKNPEVVPTKQRLG